MAVAGVDFVVGPPVNGIHALSLVLAVGASILVPMAVAGFSSEVGPTVTGVHALALVMLFLAPMAVAGFSSEVEGDCMESSNIVIIFRYMYIQINRLFHPS